MDYHALFEISAAGMGFEKKRLEVAAMNVANMHTSTAPGAAGYRALRVVVQPMNVDFGQFMGREVASGAAPGGTVSIMPTDDAPRLVRDPGHPHADERGFVSYPAVDQATEMINAMTALRAYEANVAALGFARAMATRALEIGGQR